MSASRGVVALALASTAERAVQTAHLVKARTKRGGSCRRTVTIEPSLVGLKSGVTDSSGTLRSPRSYPGTYTVG